MRLDGDKKRRANGTLIDLTAEKAGGGLDKFTRQYLQNMIAIATAELSEGNFDNWAEAVFEIQVTLRKNDWQHETFLSVCQGIEDTAVEICGDPRIGEMGRHWLMRKRDKLFFGPQT